MEDPLVVFWVLVAGIICAAFAFGIVALLPFYDDASYKGYNGENRTKYFIRKFLDSNIYLPLHDVIIPDRLGGTTQIDHILLSPYGIFVIETKNMSGWIFGSKSSARWMQIIHHKRCQFQSPIRQNFKHVKCLAALLGLPSSAFTSVVVFVGDGLLKTRSELPPSVVVGGRDMANFIKTFTTVRYRMNNLEKIKNAITAAQVPRSGKCKTRHVKYVKGIAGSN